MAPIARAAARGHPHPVTQRGKRRRRTFLGPAGSRAPRARLGKVHRGHRAAVRPYDAQSRRITKTVGQTATHFFFNESWQVLETRVGSGPNPLDQYLWDIRYIDAAVVRFHDAGANGSYEDAGDNILYYTQDANFNTTALVDEATGDVVERYLYDPYGKATVLDDDWAADGDNASDVANVRLFQGQEFNPETGLDSSRMRPVYHPTLGVWASRDIPYIDGTNLYAYCGSDPPNLVDPEGLAAVTDYVLGAKVAQTYISRAQNGPVQRLRNWTKNWEDALDIQATNFMASALIPKDSEIAALTDSVMREFATNLCGGERSANGSPKSESYPEQPFTFHSWPLSDTLGTGWLSGEMTGTVTKNSACECGLVRIDASWKYKDTIQFMDWASSYENGWFSEGFVSAGLAALEGWFHLNNDTINGASFPLLATWKTTISACCEELADVG